MTCDFPAIGHRYLVDFIAFRVQLYFASAESLTYYNVAKDGTIVGSETLAIKVEPIAERIFLVTWQESDKTTVVHIENYVNNTIVTNITGPDLSFRQFHGAFVELC